MGDHNIANLVGAWASHRPTAPAVCDDRGTTLTYGDLWERAGTFADLLAAGGVGAGTFIAVDLRRSLDLVVCLLGIVRAGAAYVPLDAHAPAERVQAILAATGAPAVVRDAPDGGPVVEWHTPAVPAGQPAGPGHHTAAVGPDDPVYVAYTSGSTGEPKGVVVPHRAVRRLAVGQPYCPLGPGDRVAHCANPAFDATTFEIWSTLCAGATVVVLPTVTDLALDDWIRLVRGRGVTTMFLTTSLFHMVARERPDAFGFLRDLLVGGEQMPLDATRAVLAAAPPRRLLNAYGPTETTTFATWYRCTTESLAGVDRVPIGTALAQTTLRIVDADGRDVAGDGMGELCIGGAGVAVGYLGRPDLTAARFVPDTRYGGLMYRTGDLARWLPGGNVELRGRADRQVKMRGFRIELEEIERAAVRTGLVTATFVELVGEGPGAMLVGFALPPAGGELSTSDLTAALRRLVPGYMLPTRWVPLTALPVGPTGKVDRDRLVALLDATPEDPPDHPSGVDDQLSCQVRQIWQEVLGRGAVRTADNFLDLGGNSILAVQVTSRLRQRLRVEVEAADVLLAHSLADLITTVRNGGA